MRKVMTSLGKEMRSRRLTDPVSGAIIAVPMDHGFTLGPIKGIADIRDTVDNVFAGGASCVVVHRGIVRNLVGVAPEKGVMVHVSGSVSFSPNANSKILTASVRDALAIGADGVSFHVNVGASEDKEMLRDAATVCSDAEKFGLPVLAMMYARGDDGKDMIEPTKLAHVARIAEEIGADIAKVNATEGGKDFDEVTQGVHIPVVIAGGSKVKDFDSFLKTVEGCILNGASGVSIGRNIFQSDTVKLATEKVVETVQRAMSER